MLPRHGFAYGVFLLAHAARLAPRRDVDEWIRAARAHGSFLAAATDLHSPTKALIQLGLARVEGDVALAPPLLALSDTADRATLQGIARLLLAVEPPLWLRLAVSATGVAREYIPREDMEALQWLEPDLDQVLLDAHAELGTERKETLQKAIGDAAELFVLAALKHAGLRPIHVARLSDAYGYDIEDRTNIVERIEVKAAGPKTRGSFHLTRNEFEKSRTYGPEWRLLQVVFTSAAFIAESLDASHIEGIYELAPGVISATVPADTPGFVWMESAILTPPADAWRSAQVSLDPDFGMPGLRTNAA